jgi:hypothetical protein
MYDNGIRKLIRAVHNRFTGLSPRVFRVGQYEIKTETISMKNEPAEAGWKDVKIWVCRKLKGHDLPVGNIEMRLLGGDVKLCVVQYIGGTVHLGEAPREVHDYIRTLLTYVLDYAKAHPHHIKCGLTPEAQREMKGFLKKVRRKS